MQGWVGWSGMLEGKEGSLCGPVCGLYGEIKDVYVSTLMKVCYILCLLHSPLPT